MSDHWEFFPCQIGENTAFVFYDHGISATIDSFKENQQVRFDLTYKAPAETGLPTNEEFDAVNDVEDRLDAFVEAGSGLYVGRVTMAGHRYFYSYVGAAAERLDEFCRDTLDATGYALEYRLLDDPGKKGYWDDLYPTADDLQMISDTKVTTVLKNAGDDNQIVRRIDHWAYFKSKDNAKQYVAWVQAEGFTIASFRRVKLFTGDWKVRFHRSDSPELYGINTISNNLRRKAAAYDGKYDGWETSVESGD